MQQRMGDYFSTLMSDPAYVKQFRQSVLDRMVNDELIQQRANKLGLSVSNEQVKQEILAMPAFAVNGVFNNEQYNMALRRAGFTPDQFAETIRKDMLRQQFLSALQGSDFVLTDEADELRKLESQQRVVRTLTLNLADFTQKVKVTDKEAQDFYDQNPNLFTRPAQIKVSYVELSDKGLTKDIKVSEQAAETYYKDNQTKFSSAEEREVSHILIKGDTTAAKAKAEALLAKLQSGANFAEVAKQSSDDTFSAKDGGKLEWFTKGMMDPAFEQEAFALAKPGDMSGLVKSSFGYHIILLDGIKAGKVKPFDDGMNSDVIELGPEHVIVVRVDDARAEAVLPFKDVAAKVNAMVASQKGEQQAQAKADEIMADLRKGKNDIVAKDGLSFSGEQTINRSGPNVNISNVAFSLPKPATGKATYGIARDNNGNVEIIALDKVVTMKLAGEKVDGQFAEQIGQMFAQEDLAATLKTLRESAEISYPMQDESKD